MFEFDMNNKGFTDTVNNNNQTNNNVAQQQLGETKRKKLMKVLNDLVDLRKTINQDN